MTFCVRQLPVRVRASIRQLYPGYVVGVAFTMVSERGKRQLRTLMKSWQRCMRLRRRRWWNIGNPERSGHELGSGVRDRLSGLGADANTQAVTKR